MHVIDINLQIKMAPKTSSCPTSPQSIVSDDIESMPSTEDSTTDAVGENAETLICGTVDFDELEAAGESSKAEDKKARKKKKKKAAFVEKNPTSLSPMSMLSPMSSKTALSEASESMLSPREDDEETFTLEDESGTLDETDWNDELNEGEKKVSLLSRAGGRPKKSTPRSTPKSKKKSVVPPAVVDIPDDESEASLMVLMRYIGCTPIAYGEGAGQAEWLDDSHYAMANPTGREFVFESFEDDDDEHTMLSDEEYTYTSASQHTTDQELVNSWTMKNEEVGVEMGLDDLVLASPPMSPRSSPPMSPQSSCSTSSSKAGSIAKKSKKTLSPRSMSPQSMMEEMKKKDKALKKKISGSKKGTAAEKPNLTVETEESTERKKKLKKLMKSAEDIGATNVLSDEQLSAFLTADDVPTEGASNDETEEEFEAETEMSEASSTDDETEEQVEEETEKDIEEKAAEAVANKSTPKKRVVAVPTTKQSIEDLAKMSEASSAAAAAALDKYRKKAVSTPRSSSSTAGKTRTPTAAATDSTAEKKVKNKSTAKKSTTKKKSTLTVASSSTTKVKKKTKSKAVVAKTQEGPASPAPNETAALSPASVKSTGSKKRRPASIKTSEEKSLSSATPSTDSPEKIASADETTDSSSKPLSPISGLSQSAKSAGVRQLATALTPRGATPPAASDLSSPMSIGSAPIPSDQTDTEVTNLIAAATAVAELSLAKNTSPALERSPTTRSDKENSSEEGDIAPAKTQLTIDTKAEAAGEQADALSPSTKSVKEVDELLSKTRQWLVTHNETQTKKLALATPTNNNTMAAPAKTSSSDRKIMGNITSKSVLNIDTSSGSSASNSGSPLKANLSPKTKLISPNSLMDQVRSNAASNGLASPSLLSAPSSSSTTGEPKKSILEQLAEIRAKQHDIELKQQAKKKQQQQAAV